MLKPDRHVIWNLGILGLLALLYGVVVVVLFAHLNYAGAPFAAGTVVVGAWLFGVRGGLLTSVLMVLEKFVLLQIFGTIGAVDLLKNGGIAGIIAIGVIGVAVGRISSLDHKLKEYAVQLQHQALHDPLTGLPNRSLFADRLEHATARSARGAGALAVIFIDLDGFKQINDRYGHAVGDRLLQAVGSRLEGSLRMGDTLARLGGDEFVVLIEDLGQLEAARQAADRLAQSIARPFVIGDEVYTISASIGVAFCPPGFTHSSDLLRDADRAMYQAKATGSGRYQVYQPLVA